MYPVASIPSPPPGCRRREDSGHAQQGQGSRLGHRRNRLARRDLAACGFARRGRHRGIIDERPAGADGQARSVGQGVGVCHVQRAGVDRRAARVGVAAAEDQLAAANLRQATGAGRAPARVSVLPSVSKTPLLPAVSSTMGTLVEKSDPAWNVPPLKLKAALPEPWVKPRKTQQTAVEVVGSRGTRVLAKDEAAGIRIGSARLREAAGSE